MPDDLFGAYREAGGCLEKIALIVAAGAAVFALLRWLGLW